MRTTTKNLALAAVASMALFTAACGSDDTSGDDTASEETSAAPAEDDPAANLVGKDCAAYAEQFPDGPGSVEGMAQDPVATAASNNDFLTQLTAAVSGELNPDVNLVDTLNGDEFTVFAPTDEAFEALPADVQKTLATPEGAKTLEQVLTYHVVPGQLTPDEVVGKQTSVQGEDVDVTGEGESLKFNDANLVCGGVKTANATVYMIDKVMMPPSAS